MPAKELGLKPMDEHETDPVFHKALEWFAVMNDDAASDEDCRRFARWIDADARHAAAYERARLLWDRFEIVKPEYQRLKDRQGINRRAALITGAAALLAIPAALMWRYGVSRPDYETAVGERRSFNLPDGSIVELGSYSALSMTFGERERRLVLERGQGFFTVAPDAARPFIVAAGSGETRALGTQFDVKVMGGEVVVTVAESSVAVTYASAAPVRLETGWQVNYSGIGIGEPSEVDVSIVAAWRNDRIVFEDVPLRSVLRELERYRRGSIVLMDRSIGNIPVTAVFDTRDTDQALSVIAQTLPIRIVNAAGLMSFVYRR